MVRVAKAQAALRKNEVPHAAGTMARQPIDEFFLLMTYLFLGLLQKDLVHRLKTHQSAVSCIINTWANFLYTLLGAVGIWLSEETVKAYLPDVFSQLLRYSSGAAVLLQSSISDKEMLMQSGIVTLLKSTAAIMVDKGFLVEDCVPNKVYIPAFLSKRELPGSEVKETQSIARLRVHVEQLNRRVKEHKIFSTVIPLSLTGSVNQLYAAACLLVNYQNGLSQSTTCKC